MIMKTKIECRDGNERGEGTVRGRGGRRGAQEVMSPPHGIDEHRLDETQTRTIRVQVTGLWRGVGQGQRGGGGRRRCGGKWRGRRQWRGGRRD